MAGCFSCTKYDVFLSFRGENTRNGFTSHLCSALENNKIKTYMVDKLKGGDEISTSLLKAIEKSKLSVIIFSKNYASSSWCLDELVQILKCKNKHGQIVVPIFYGVDPSHVRIQYVISSNRFEAKKKKLQAWKKALKKVTKLAGWMGFSPDSKLVEKIVKDIKKNLIKSSAHCRYAIADDRRPPSNSLPLFHTRSLPCPATTMYQTHNPNLGFVKPKIAPSPFLHRIFISSLLQLFITSCRPKLLHFQPWLIVEVLGFFFSLSM
ncbi:hypothetical protein UlMin_030173 [Ulmus minor]